MLQRTEIARATAKIVAYQNCGSIAKAQEWARMLQAMLQDEGLL